MWGWIIGGFLVATFVPAAMRVAFDHLLKPKLQGAAQESLINKMFKKFKGKGFARLNDVMVRTGEKTNQIDNLLITRYGIFVIESKNYSGIIQGRERTPRWLQISPNGKHKPREFFNPIWQNEGHIRALKQILGRKYPKLPYHNLVVFSDNCQCPRVPGVVKVSDMNQTIKKAMSGPPILSEEDVAALKELLEKSNIKDHKSRAEHLDQVQDAAFKAKERERNAALRERAEAHKADAQEIEAILWEGVPKEKEEHSSKAAEVAIKRKVSLEEQINGAKPEPKGERVEKAPEKETGIDR